MMTGGTPTVRSRPGTRLLPLLAGLAILTSVLPLTSPVLATTREAIEPPAPVLAAPPFDRIDTPPALDEVPGKDPDVEGRIGDVLRTEVERGNAAALARARELGLAVDKGRIRIVIETSVTLAARRSVVAAGATVEASADGLVQALATPGQVRRLRGSDGVGYVRPPLSRVEQGVPGEGVSVTGADAWHAAGLTGAGIKVAVIDLGFAGLGSAQANGDLPGDVATFDYCSGGFHTATEHGTAVAEIVHEMAPAAELLLLCIDTEVQLSQAVDYAKSRGVDVINHSIGWINAGRGDGTGQTGTPDATAADAAAAGILWVNSVGNQAQVHWTGAFVEAPGTFQGANGWHDFAAGDVGNSFIVQSGSGACVSLKWDDWPATDQDFDLYVADSAGDLVGGSQTAQTGAQAPTEIACFMNDGQTAVFSASIHRYEATATPRFDLFVFGVADIQYPVADGSLLEPASSPATLAAGAVCWSESTIQPYSSRGPTIDGRVKPDLSGQDGVSSFTYGAAASCGAGGGFGGTSAAAPHVAGAAALVMSRYPAYGASQARSFLVANVLDLGPAGTDATYGAGLLRLTAPGSVVELSSTPNPSAIGGSVTLTATVTPATATGTVTFRDVTAGDPAELGVATLDGGVATMTTSLSTSGTRRLVAEYAGDGTHSPGVSAPISHGVIGTVLTPTSTSVVLTPNPVAWGTVATFTATVTPNPGAGSITWIIDGVEAETTPVGPAGTSSITRTYWETGIHTVRASFAEGTLLGGSESPQAVLTVVQKASIVLSANRSAAVAGETLVTFTATMGEPDAWGSVTFIDTLGTTSTSLGTAALVEDDEGVLRATLPTRLKGIGTHQVHASYGGSATYGPADSGPVAIAVTPDIAVSASGVGVSYGTFYPYKDGYRDKVAIRGTPGEPVSVTIKVYNSSAKRVRSWSLPTRTSPWSVAWNGRTASGTRLAAGKYKVVQEVRDLAGHTRSFTSYTTISNKRLYWYTGSRTKYADTGTFYGYGESAGAYRSGRYSGGVILDGGYCEYDWETDEEVCDLAVGRHRFTLPTARAYSSIRLSVLGRSWSGWGAGYEGIEDYAAGEIDAARSIGYSFAWYTTSSVGSTGHVNGSRIVTGFVWASGGNEGVVEYQKVRVTYRYALLK